MCHHNGKQHQFKAGDFVAFIFLWSSTVRNIERNSTVFISLKLVLVYRALISNTRDVSHSGNRLIMPQHKVKGWQRELPDSLVN